jgi:hypothetical protein
VILRTLRTRRAVVNGARSAHMRQSDAIIVVGIDGSEGSEQALMFAAGEAALRGAGSANRGSVARADVAVRPRILRLT